MVEFPRLPVSPKMGRLTVCAVITSSEKRIKNLLAKLPFDNETYAKLSSRTVVGVSAGTEEKNRHLHVDLLDSGLVFAPPTAKSSLAAIRRYVEPFMGEKAVCRVSAAFFLPIEKLPEGKGVVGPPIAGFQHPSGVSIRQSRGELSIVGSRVKSISWTLRNDGKEVLVEIEMVAGVTLNSDYLVKWLRRARLEFARWVLGREGEKV